MEDCCPYWVRIFCACLATIYVPAIWLQVKVVLIPKPSRSSYTRPRDFRSINLISVLLETMERLVDRFLRKEDLTLMLNLRLTFILVSIIFAGSKKKNKLNSIFF